MPKFVLALIFVLGVALLAAGGYLHYKTNPKYPNVVFVLLDTFRADRIHGEHNGKPITPFLNSLAERSLYYKNAISPSSWTRPSMAALLTATDVFSNRVFRSVEQTNEGMFSDILCETFETMAEYFAANHYEPFGVQTNFNGSAEFGLAQGFPTANYNFLGRVPGAKVTNAALAALKGNKSPFFLYVHYMDAHGPYNPPDEYREAFGPEPELSVDERTNLSPENFTAYLFDRLYTNLGIQPAPTKPELTANGIEAAHLRYDASCRYLDDQIAKLIRMIETAAPNTIFVVMADHGEELWERKGFGHGHTLYQELVHVPLIISGPGIPARTVESLVPSHAILPTLAEIIGLPTRAQWQTQSILPKPGREAGPAFSLTKGSSNKEGLELESAIDGNSKLVWNRKADTAFRFNLAADPGEQHPISDPADPETIRLKAAIEARHQSTGVLADACGRSALNNEEASKLLGEKVAPGAQAAPAPSGAAHLSEDDKEKLRNLGYLHDDVAATPPPAPAMPEVPNTAPLEAGPAAVHP